jgi:CRISPR-associated protein Csx17
MHTITLSGCTAAPFGGYFKALGAFRLVAEQADNQTRGWWEGDTFQIESKLTKEELLTFFLERYEPTAILAPWNGGSGFYAKDNKDGIDAIASSTHPRFAEYRRSIEICREMPEVKQGKGEDEDQRRTGILLRCRNTLSDRGVEWLDAAVGIAADGKRSFAPVLGTGGNEGRLDYTNNFMARLAALLISPDKKTPVRELLANSLFGERTMALQAGAAGQFDPGRAGGANQGPGVEHDSSTNPWDLVLTLEGTVAWASGLYRRQGVAYRAVLCSPFTVRAQAVGYGSASNQDDARAEVWAPLWDRPVRFAELKALLREGRASVEGRPAQNTLEFAEAACSLGVDRGIRRFVRYCLLKRRGDSYVALPAGIFPAGYRSNSDRVREFQRLLEAVTARGLPKGTEDLRRHVDAAVYQALLIGGSERMRELMAALGRMVRRIATTTEMRLPTGRLPAWPWLEACGFASEVEVRIAAAVASMWSPDVGGMADHLTRADKRFAWSGSDLPRRLVSVLDRRLQLANAVGSRVNPLGGACAIHPGDATRFLEGTVDDTLVEDLLFAFVTLDWKGFRLERYPPSAEVVPSYAVLKHLFLPGEIRAGREPKRLPADARIVSLLASGNIQDATEIAVARLRIAGLHPLDVKYHGGMDALRLAAALLIPVWSGKALASGIFHEQEQEQSIEASA